MIPPIVRIPQDGDMAGAEKLRPKVINNYLEDFKSQFNLGILKQNTKTYEEADGTVIKISIDANGLQPVYTVNISTKPLIIERKQYSDIDCIFLIYGEIDRDTLPEFTEKFQCYVFTVDGSSLVDKSEEYAQEIADNSVSVNNSGVFMNMATPITHLKESVVQSNKDNNKHYFTTEIIARDPFTYYKNYYRVPSGDIPYGVILYDTFYDIYYTQGFPKSYVPINFSINSNQEFTVGETELFSLFDVYSLAGINVSRINPRRTWSLFNSENDIIKALYLKTKVPPFLVSWTVCYTDKEGDQTKEHNGTFPIHTIVDPDIYLGVDKTFAGSAPAQRTAISLPIVIWSHEWTSQESTIIVNCSNSEGVPLAQTSVRTTKIGPVMSNPYTVYDVVPALTIQKYNIFNKSIPLTAKTGDDIKNLNMRVTSVRLNELLDSWDTAGWTETVYKVYSNPGCAGGPCAGDLLGSKIWGREPPTPCENVQWEVETKSDAVESIYIISHASSPDNKYWIALLCKRTVMSGYSRYTWDLRRGWYWNGYSTGISYLEDFYILTSESDLFRLDVDQHLVGPTKYWTKCESLTGWKPFSNTHSFLSSQISPCGGSPTNFYTSSTWQTDVGASVAYSTEMTNYGEYILAGTTAVSDKFLTCSYNVMKVLPDIGIGAGPDEFVRRDMFIYDLDKKTMITKSFTDVKYDLPMAIGVHKTKREVQV